MFCRKGSDAGDHPPITPMRPATEAELGHDAWRLYDLITRHFIATVSRFVSPHNVAVSWGGGSVTAFALLVVRMDNFGDAGTKRKIEKEYR